MIRSTNETSRGGEVVAIGSERSFARVMALALVLLAALNWWRNGLVWPWLCGAFLILAAGYVHPSALKPLNRLWFKFGLMLHAVINPMVMGILFYGVVLPTGLVMRALGKDPLRITMEPDRDSYWISRQPPGPAPESMKDQF